MMKPSGLGGPMRGRASAGKEKGTYVRIEMIEGPMLGRSGRDKRRLEMIAGPMLGRSGGINLS